MTLDPTAALSLYDEAWAISDYESRLVSLRTFWADDGLYVDPDVPEGVRGPEALATEIERQLKLYPGMSIVSTLLMSSATALGSAGARQSGRESPSTALTSSSSPPTAESPG